MSPFCSKTMENSHSPGGLTTLNLVIIDRGYWRATPSGEKVLPCYNTEACLGGLTGAPCFCFEGYEGPCKYVTLSVHLYLLTTTNLIDMVALDEVSAFSSCETF